MLDMEVPDGHPKKDVTVPRWRVCLLSSRFPPDEGGVAVSVQRNATLLSEAGMQVHVCVLDSRLAEGATVDESSKQIAVHRVGGKPSPDILQEWFASIVRLHRRYHFDLLHAFYLVPSGYVAVLAARFLGLPAVVSARGNDIDRLLFDGQRFGMLLWTLQNAPAVTAVSRELQEKILALVAGCPVRFVPNSVDAEFFRPAESKGSLLRKLELDPLPTLLFSGEARQKKGLAVLLTAFAQLHVHVPANLILAGGVRGEDSPILDRFLVKHKDLAARLRVLPYLPAADLVDYYNLADVVVLPSLQDGLPNSLLEAMACARPVIAAAVGGIVDVISDGVDGFLVPPRDPHVLATAIHRLLNMPNDRLQAGLRARSTVQTRFSPDLELSGNLEIYSRLLRHAAL